MTNPITTDTDKSNMAEQKIRNTTGRPQNVLAKENRLNLKITEEMLPSLPSFVGEYNDFLDSEGRSVKTRLAYIKDLSYFFDYMVADTGLSSADKPKDITLSDMENLKGRDVNAYLSYVRRYTLPDGTVVENGKDARARKRSSISGLLKYLYTHDLIEHDITGKILSISVKESERAVKALQENEIMDLLDTVSTGRGLTDKQKYWWEKTRYRDSLIIGLFTICGLRVSELQQLNISSFNLKREEFVIYRKRGKESVIPMNKSLIELFTEYMEYDRSLVNDVAFGHEDALFLCLHAEEKSKEGTMIPSGRKRLSEQQIRALVKKYTSVVIGGSGYSPHKLRATAATTAIRRGNDISRVASLLDHDSVQTTQRYVKVTEEDKRLVLADLELESDRRTLG